MGHLAPGDGVIGASMVLLAIVVSHVLRMLLVCIYTYVVVVLSVLNPRI